MSGRARRGLLTAGLLAVGLPSAAGCGNFGLQPAPDSGGADSGEVPCGALCVQAVSPDWGPLEGGTAVEIRGQGFGDAPEVRFGSQALEVTVLDEGRVVVTSPEARVAGGVDITVRAGDASDTLYDGFTYVDGGGGGDDSGGEDNSGRVSGLVELSLFGVGCPSCFGSSSALDYSVAAAFHAPTAGSWFDWLPPVGSCALDPSPSALSAQYEDVGERVYLNSGPVSLSLRRQGSGSSAVYSAAGLDEGDWVSGGTWDLEAPDGNFDAANVAWGPEYFDDISPIAILEDGARAFTASINRSNARFAWSPSGVADGFIVRLDVYNSSGSAFLGTVLCHSQDTGSLTVPSSAFTGYPTRALLAVWLYRFQQGGGTRSDDGSTVQSGVSIGVLGTATLN